jgi:hypothetical protein
MRSENEIPPETVDGIRADFSLAHLPINPNGVVAYVGGVRGSISLDYTVAGRVVTFQSGAIPPAGETVLFDYDWTSTSPTPEQLWDTQLPEQVEIIGGVGQLTHDPVSASSVKVWLAGLRLRQGVNYTVSGRTLTLLAGYVPPSGETLWVDYTWSQLPFVPTAADGTPLPRDIDTISALVTDPPYGDPTITVVQVAQAAGGVSSDLDQLGIDQGMPRRAGELDVPYRARLRQLPDVVSPAAIKRAIRAAFPTTPAFFIEVWETAFQTCYDVPNIADLPASSPLADPAVNSCFFYDDTRGPGGPRVPEPSGFYGRWLDENTERGTFIVVVPNSGVLDRGVYYDDPNSTSGATASSYVGQVAQRAWPFVDLTSAANVSILSGFYDEASGGAQPLAATYVGLYAILAEIKAAGVTALLELAPPLG